MMNLLVRYILWPGDIICTLFKVKEGESRFFLRLYLNLFIYTKVAVGIAFALAVYT